MSVARAGFDFGNHYGRTARPVAGARRVLAGQGITGETKAILSFFGLIVVGTFVLGSIDSNLALTNDPANATGALANYSDAGSAASGGYLDFINIGIVLPVVVVGGLMLAVISRVL